MGRFSEAKKLEAVKAVAEGTPAADVAKRLGVRPETLQGWTDTKASTPALKVVHSPKVRARAGRVTLPQAGAGAGALRAALKHRSAAQALALMYKSGLPVEAFREALALLEG